MTWYLCSRSNWSATIICKMLDFIYGGILDDAMPLLVTKRLTKRSTKRGSQGGVTGFTLRKLGTLSHWMATTDTSLPLIKEIHQNSKHTTYKKPCWALQAKDDTWWTWRHQDSGHHRKCNIEVWIGNFLDVAQKPDITFVEKWLVVDMTLSF